MKIELNNLFTFHEIIIMLLTSGPNFQKTRNLNYVHVRQVGEDLVGNISGQTVLKTSLNNKYNQYFLKFLDRLIFMDDQI